MKCPRCGGVLNEYGDLFVCESCGAKFKNKSAQREQKQEEQVVQNTATESVIMPETKNESEKSELELLKERLAEMEKRQSEMESGGSHRNADFKGKFSQIKETKFFGFLKKWGLKVILPCVLAFIVLISLMVSLVGVRGVYYNVNNPNEFYSFSSSKYEYYGDFNGEEYVDKGTWKTKNGKLYLTYKDEEFGKQTDEYYFSKQSNKVIFIGEEKDSLSEFKRVSLSKYKPSSNKKVKITFDANGGSGDTSVSYSFGSKSKEVPQTEREGYFFKGWYKDKYGYKISGSKPYEEGKRVWEDVTYYANWWSDKTYTLTVEGTDIALELEEGDSLLSKLKETEKGYAYNYFIDGALVDENTRMPANPVTISRQQTSTKIIKLTLNAVGGNFNGAGEIIKEVAYNSDFTLDVPKSKGMFFAGYVIYPKNSEASISVATHDGSLANDFWNNVYEDVTLYALWIDLATELADFKYEISDDGICITNYIGKNAVVKILDGVTSIGERAFYGCTGLTSVTIPDSVTSIGNSAFYNCNNTQDIYITDIAAWFNISGLGNLMRYGASNKTLYINNELATSIKIPDGVKAIPSYAFYGCTGLTSVTIGKGVTGIDSEAFYNCTGLTTVNWNATACTIAGSSFYPIFRSCSNLATVNIGDNVKIIPSYAFYNRTGLTSVTIGKGVTSIGERAFYGCDKLQDIYITDIGAWCNISGLDNLMRYGASNKKLYINNKLATSITIPNGVKAIPASAFYNCTGLTSVTIPDSVTSIGGSAFDNTLWYDNQPDGLVYAGKVAYKYKGTMPSNTSIVLKEGTLGITDYAFWRCYWLESVTIPDSVTSIGDYAFYDTTLTSITVAKGNTKYHSAGNCLIETGSKTLIVGCANSIIPTDGSVTSIGSYAFFGRGGLTSVTIPDSVTSISRSAFEDCKGLTSVTIPDSVTSIGERAFYGCTGLRSVTIGSGVTSIGDYAFYGCTRLTSITFNGTIAQWRAISKGNNWNNDVPSECKIVCTDGTTSI